MIHYGHCELTCVVDGQLHARLHIAPDRAYKVIGNTAVACFIEREAGFEFQSLMITNGTGMFPPIRDLDEEVVIADCRALPSFQLTESDLLRMVEKCRHRQAAGYFPAVHSERYWDDP